MIGFWGSFIYGLYLLPGFCFQTEYWIVWKILFVIVWVIVLSYMVCLLDGSRRVWAGAGVLAVVQSPAFGFAPRSHFFSRLT